MSCCKFSSNRKGLPRLVVSALATALMSSSLLGPSPLSAQSDSGASPDETAGPVCMVGPWRSAPQTMAEKRGKRFKVVVAERDAARLETRGFSRSDCANLDLASNGRQAAWRDEICAMAAFGNDAVQDQFARALGIRPAELCASAEMSVGPWNGRRPTVEGRMLDEIVE